MRLPTPRDRLGSVFVAGENVRRALADLFSQKFSWSTGHLAAVLNGCLFAPSLVTFWFVSGVLDFSTAVAICAISTPAGLRLRLFAYLLLVPTFLVARVVAYLIHPRHRGQVLAARVRTRHS